MVGRVGRGGEGIKLVVATAEDLLVLSQLVITPIVLGFKQDR